MNDTIRIRAGNRWKDGKDQLASITLGDRELVYCKDENALYIGTAGGGKKKIGGGGGGGTGGTSVNADLSQNDPTAPDYVKNRTHWKEEHSPIEWDGSTEGRDSFDASNLGYGVLYKVSDEVWTKEQAQLAKLYVLLRDKGERSDSLNGCSILLEDDAIGFAAFYGFGFDQGLVAFFAKQAIDLTSVYGFSIPSAGCYFFLTYNFPFIEYSVGIQIPSVIQKLDYEFLPDDLVTEAKVETMIADALGVVENGTY